jgi:NDP-sugar pyrophosphorylase family protein
MSDAAARAVILAGGQGTRLLPYTTLVPKPLVPLGGKYSILEIVLLQLARCGFTRVTLAVNHLSNLVMAYFGDGSKWNLKLDYSVEDEPLSTIGPLTLIGDLPEHFLVMNGDILCDLDYRAFYEAHGRHDRAVSVCAYRRTVEVDFGVLRYGSDMRLAGFDEKPSLAFDVSMGIYCLDRSVIDELERGKAYGFDDLMRDSLRLGRPVHITPFGGFWLDIGRPEDYQYADENFEKLAPKLGITLQ